MAGQFQIDLQEKVDGLGGTYFVGVLQMPCKVDLSDGFVFLIWPHRKGESDDLPSMVMKPKGERRRESDRDGEGRNDKGRPNQRPNQRPNDRPNDNRLSDR